MESVRVLLISTYDLGRQPLGLASPAAWLRNEGVEVTCVDTSRDTLTDDQIGEADSSPSIFRCTRRHDWPPLSSHAPAA